MRSIQNGSGTTLGLFIVTPIFPMHITLAVQPLFGFAFCHMSHGFVCRLLFCQVLRNLVSNAIKFSPQGGKVTLRIFFDDTPQAAEIVVPKSKPKKSNSGGGLSNIVGGAPVRKSMRDTPSVEPSSFEEGDKDEQGTSGSGHGQIRDQIHVIDSFLLASALNVVGEFRQGQLVIVVTDNGPGISEANQQKLFRGVIQFDPEKNQGGGGSGFGLFISKGIVDLHCGSIAVQSEGEGHGCSFVLAMPMVRADVDPTAVPVDTIDPSAAAVATNPASANNVKSEHAQGGPRRGSLKQVAVDWVDTMVPSTGRNTSGDNADLSRKKYRLLIVDDSSLSRKMLCKSLRFAGHECDEAEDGLIALNKVKEKLGCSGVGSSSTMMYDAVLMDTNMPNLDGPSAAKAMRDCGVTIPIFGVTGNGEEKDIEHYKSQGATAVFVKPFDMNNFVRHMKELEFSKSQP